MPLFSLPAHEADTPPEPLDADSRRHSCGDDVELCCRLTAAEELHGHLRDCFSLFASRFEHTTVALACIQALFPSSPPPARSGALPGTPEASEAEADAPRSAGGAFDLSTVATVLFLHVEDKLGACLGAAAGSNDEAKTPLLGVVVAFQYWRGFHCVAERRYASAAEAQGEAAALERGNLTVSELLRMPQWQLISESAAEASLSPTPGSGHAKLNTSPGSTDLTSGFSGIEENTVAKHGAAYESLMALMVDTYL
ncbi:hypothetical protein conserved [Leishmania donovani]|uniref:Uncharacterized protein n=3 Tax=Leishmania donovani species complex TaxID=38574 RepID=A4HT39_LEIIN|nr:conserved hypothetical protein [Leishmania infantum JPCM5]CAC9448042.1 hypothetical_protein_-_conserved [Leishmania infantum]CAJ1986256.1 hypothetical protein conserved [Leishmania donovani]CAM65584.1 conserved hypothetical protein [Leishmania infantum JPCM5]SUZ39207.1 hypothetical_protein_-_conserved [Leishmania infantum]VDZ42155.1 hypothetical_protein_conserved [Leishmania donovani]|eukprot:XP_001463230.1 conserved hypothetical protein [Leishmania infantum JPCM5]